MMLETLKKRLRKHPRLFNALRAVKIFQQDYLPGIVCGDRRRANRALCLISARLGLPVSLGRPMLLNIEPTTVCDQKCVICETGLGILGRKPQFMTLDEFQRILDQFDDNLEEMFYYFMGESFLNKDAYRMIRLAADRGVYVSVCTNGNFVEPEALVRSGLADVYFQISGTTQDIHEIYRVGGKLEVVLDTVRETVRLRDELAEELTASPHRLKIGLGFILFRHNEHQIDDFLKLAQSMGVDEYQVIDPCVRNVEQGLELLPTDKGHWVYDPEAFARGELRMRRPPQNECEWIYATMTVQVNGDVVPCCRDPKGKLVMGNVFTSTAREIWNNAAFRHLRRQVSTVQSVFPLCSLCEGYGMPRRKGSPP